MDNHGGKYSRQKYEAVRWPLGTLTLFWCQLVRCANVSISLGSNRGTRNLLALVSYLPDYFSICNIRAARDEKKIIGRN